MYVLYELGMRWFYKVYIDITISFDKDNFQIVSISTRVAYIMAVWKTFFGTIEKSKFFVSSNMHVTHALPL